MANSQTTYAPIEVWHKIDPGSHWRIVKFAWRERAEAWIKANPDFAEYSVNGVRMIPLGLTQVAGAEARYMNTTTEEER